MTKKLDTKDTKKQTVYQLEQIQHQLIELNKNMKLAREIQDIKKIYIEMDDIHLRKIEKLDRSLFFSKIFHILQGAMCVFLVLVVALQ